MGERSVRCYAMGCLATAFIGARDAEHASSIPRDLLFQGTLCCCRRVCTNRNSIPFPPCYIMVLIRRHMLCIVICVGRRVEERIEARKDRNQDTNST
eukprot:jgi/Mesvir1/17211/Mv26421-RA.1